MKTVNLQVRINEDLKQEVSSILKTQGLSYTSMLDALFRQIIVVLLYEKAPTTCWASCSILATTILAKNCRLDN